MKFEPAACVVIPTGNAIEEILAISRRNDFTKWGIPGGKQDSGESNVECACREIHEELGIRFNPVNLIPLYSGPCYGADGRDFWVTSYLLNGIIRGSFIVRPEDGFQVQPMELIELCNEKTSPFAHYNQHVVSAWRSLK